MITRAPLWHSTSLIGEALWRQQSGLGDLLDSTGSVIVSGGGPDDLAAFLNAGPNPGMLPGTGQLQVGQLAANSAAAGGYLIQNANGTYSVNPASGTALPSWLLPAAALFIGAVVVFGGHR